MANPQKENGFTPIANELLDAIIRWHFSSYEIRILIFLLRKTYGWKKKEDWISLSQFSEGTKIKESHISRTLNLLLKQNIITKGGNRRKPKWGIQKDYDGWVELPKGVRSHHKLQKGVSEIAKGGNSNLQKGGDTKETITKETITKETRSPLRASRDSKNMKLRNENAFSDEYETILDSESNELRKELKRPNQNKRFFGFCAYFKARCKNIKGFEPEVGGLKDKVTFHKTAAKYPTEELYDIVDFFLKDKKSDEHTTITACFSNDTITNWKRYARN